MVGFLATRLARRCLAGREQEFAFRRAREPELPRISETDLYLHIPFCKSLCPYCPYNRIRYLPEVLIASAVRGTGAPSVGARSSGRPCQ